MGVIMLMMVRLAAVLPLHPPPSGHRWCTAREEGAHADAWPPSSSPSQAAAGAKLRPPPARPLAPTPVHRSNPPVRALESGEGLGRGGLDYTAEHSGECDLGEELDGDRDELFIYFRT